MSLNQKGVPPQQKQTTRVHFQWAFRAPSELRASSEPADQVWASLCACWGKRGCSRRTSARSATSQLAIWLRVKMKSGNGPQDLVLASIDQLVPLLHLFFLAGRLLPPGSIGTLARPTTTNARTKVNGLDLADQQHSFRTFSMRRQVPSKKDSPM